MIKMGGGLIGHHLCCLKCGLIEEDEAVVADEGGDGEGGWRGGMERGDGEGENATVT